MPVHDGLVKLLSGAHINYFLCQQIIEILKQTEAESKNVFGRYGSQRMKDWQEVIRLYEKDSLYIAEAAQILARNIQYEVPGLKKQITKLEQLSEETEKKIQDLIKSENILKTEHAQLCQQLGIQGDNVRKELLNKLDDLPEMYKKVASYVPALKKGIELYVNFTGNEESLTLLNHVATLGNTTVYHFLYSEAPLVIENIPLKIDIDPEEDNNKSEIDYEIDYDGQVDYGDVNVGEVNLEVGDIDWGAQDDESKSDDIDFNISLEESGIVCEGGGQSGGVAKGAEAYTILDCPYHRDQFMNELMELEAFLRMRLYELSSNTSNRMISISLMDGISGNDVDSISEMLSHVEIAFSQFTNQLIQHLNQVKHSPKYVDILATKLKQKLVAVDKTKHTITILRDRSVNFLEDAAKLKPGLTRIIDQTKILQDQIERDISKRYKNRMVNLIGGINTV